MSLIKKNIYHLNKIFLSIFQSCFFLNQLIFFLFKLLLNIPNFIKFWFDFIFHILYFTLIYVNLLKLRLKINKIKINLHVKFYHQPLKFCWALDFFSHIDITTFREFFQHYQHAISKMVIKKYKEKNINKKINKITLKSLFLIASSNSSLVILMLSILSILLDYSSISTILFSCDLSSSISCCLLVSKLLMKSVISLSL